MKTTLDEVAVSNAVDAGRFKDVMIADGTVLRLHEYLFRGVRRPTRGIRMDKDSTCSTTL